MQRRRLLLLASLGPAGLLLSRYLRALAPTSPQSIDPQKQAIKYREQAIQLNDLAADIHTISDARAFIDFVVEIFSDELPPHSVSRSLRERTAQAEFAAVTDPEKLIPEERIAAAWNSCVSTIEAPQDHQATAAEIHNLRDAFFATASVFWARAAATSGLLQRSMRLPRTERLLKDAVRSSRSGSYGTLPISPTIFYPPGSA